MIHLDTHVVAWLFEARTELFPPIVSGLLEENELVVSPMVELELEYLHEIGRAEVRSHFVIGDLAGRIGLARSKAPFASIVDRARELSWTRDPFDRIIVATALVDDAPLLTRDQTILANFPGARWDGGSKKPERRARPKRR
jgi:PIN domain nuclease of toxin-antitoxin system